MNTKKCISCSTPSTLFRCLKIVSRGDWNWKRNIENSFNMAQHSLSLRMSSSLPTKWLFTTSPSFSLPPPSPSTNYADGGDKKHSHDHSRIKKTMWLFAFLSAGASISGKNYTPAFVLSFNATTVVKNK